MLPLPASLLLLRPAVTTIAAARDAPLLYPPPLQEPLDRRLHPQRRKQVRNCVPLPRARRRRQPPAAAAAASPPAAAAVRAPAASWRSSFCSRQVGAAGQPRLQLAVKRCLLLFRHLSASHPACKRVQRLNKVHLVARVCCVFVCLFVCEFVGVHVASH